jgi:S-DNA-T family DNA segregation ATPase FtsK/SpoIIIE
MVKGFSSIDIGSDESADIFFNSILLSKLHARIIHKDDETQFECIDKEYGAYINGVKASSNCKINNGDIIFIMGLRIVSLGNHLFINNPLGQVKIGNKLHKNTIKVEDVNYEDDDNDIQIYSEKDYFLRSPRITNIIGHEKVKIEAPPQAQNQDGVPILVTLGTSISMGMITLINTISTLRSITNGETTFQKALPQFAISIGLLISMLLIPVITKALDRKKKREYEKKRQVRYRAYISEKIEEINEIRHRQRDFLIDNYLSAGQCRKIIATKDSRLWERKNDDKDFLTIRLGVGTVPIDLSIEYPEKEFSMDDDELMDILNEVGQNEGNIQDAPITISLCQKNLSAIVIKDNYELTKSFLQSVLMQLITFHSYDDLKIVMLMNKNNSEAWESAKILPHLWNNQKQVRFFADSYDDMRELSQYLEEELNYRIENSEKNGEDIYKSFRPYYLIITDDYKTIRHLSFISKMIKTKINYGFSLLCLSNNLVDLPDECKTFICLDDDKGFMFESEMAEESKVDFRYARSEIYYFEDICKEIATIPIKYSMSDKMILRNTITFLEMYDVGRIEQLNVLQRWKTNDPTKSLAVPVGVDSAGMLISLDIHEKAHGPHGLIAGSTGSGKSEFIITYILSLALNFHPNDVALILIDYKGGGLAGAFQKGDIKLPHLVGTITNIDTVGLRRSLASIKSELRRRQIMFNDARNKTDGGTIDIYKYQRLYHDGIIDKPIPHLLIICDEFAELKQQQEEFMNELISVARIGRSLGVHLILATQKPAGIVNDQIRSNSRFAVCLKVQDKSDSMDVIKRPDAADLKEAGQFYMQVGNNEYFTLGIAAWSGALYYPADVTKKKLDTSIKFISNIGRVIKQIGNSQSDAKRSNGDQLTNIVKYIDRIAKQENIKVNNLWVDSIPENIYVDELRDKYRIGIDKGIIKPLIGEFDDPDSQRQGPVEINFTNGGNLIVYGNAHSGKETLLSSLVYDIIGTHTASEVNVYIMDFGTESLKVFKNAPQVGDVVFASDDEKISRLFEIITREIRSRISILSDFGGDYAMYINSGKENMPLILVIINNYESFQENYQNKYDDLFLTVTREGLKVGIRFVVTASAFSDLRYRLTQNFEQKVSLQLSRDEDYFSIWDGIGKKRPSKIFGRGLVRIENIYEMQTAKICKPELFNEVIKLKVERLKQTADTFAKHIPSLPSEVNADDISYELEGLSKVPIGVIKKTLNVYSFNFTKSIINLVSSKNIESIGKFISELIKELESDRGIEVQLFDIDGFIENKDLETMKKEYASFKDGIAKDEKKSRLCIILGIDKFISNIASDFEQTLSKAEESKNTFFIIADNAAKIKVHEYDPWYKKFTSKDNGIWIGNGMGEQFIITTEQSFAEFRNNYGKSFGYGVSNCEATLIKVLGIYDDEEEL